LRPLKVECHPQLPDPAPLAHLSTPSLPTAMVIAPGGSCTSRACAAGSALPGLWPC